MQTANKSRLAAKKKVSEICSSLKKSLTPLSYGLYATEIKKYTQCANLLNLTVFFMHNAQNT